MQKSKPTEELQFPRPILILEWTLLSTAGMAAGMVLTLLGVWLTSSLASTAVADQATQWILLPAMGLGLGVFEWLLLRRLLPRVGLWILATMLGWVIGFPLSFGITQLLSRFFGEGQAVSLIGLFQVGFFALWVGALQGMVLRRSLRFSGWWVLASLVAWSAGFALGGLNGLVLGVQLYLTAILYGLLSGYGLLLILRANLAPADGG